MLACSNTHVFGEYTISSVALSTTFRVSPWFVTSIKGCKVSVFISLASFEFLVDVPD